MFSLESPHRGDANDYTQYTIFNMSKKKHPKLSPICSYEIFSKGPKNKFETAVVNEPSVFEPLKLYCMLFLRFRPQTCQTTTARCCGSFFKESPSTPYGGGPINIVLCL